MHVTGGSDTSHMFGSLQKIEATILRVLPYQMRSYPREFFPQDVVVGDVHAVA